MRKIIRSTDDFSKMNVRCLIINIYISIFNNVIINKTKLLFPQA